MRTVFMSEVGALKLHCLWSWEAMRVQDIENKLILNIDIQSTTSTDINNSTPTIPHNLAPFH